jgi:GT2 family glycosyltransferase
VTPLASVLVVTWNGRALLERCLPALAAQTLRDRELVIVDNGSTDGSLELVARLCPDAAVVRSATNRGFAAGNNLGLARCRGRYLALLNNDCLAEPEWLERAVEAAEASGAGMVATRQLRADAPTIVDSAGIALDRAAIAWDRGGGQPLSKRPGAEGWAPPFGPSGGAGLYRRDMLADVGAFDAELVSYYEDVDLAWRARLRGWRCAEAVGARCRHLGSATAGRNWPRKRFLLGRNKLWVAAKCYPGAGLRRYLAAIAAYDLAALAAYMIASPPGPVSAEARLAALRGRLDGLRGLPGQLEKRRRVQARRSASVEEVMAAMTPLRPPWLVATRFGYLPEGSVLPRAAPGQRPP